jgi:hypothetical protein
MASFKVSCAELFGLPSSGKSYFLMSNNLKVPENFMNYNKCKVQNRHFMVKTINVIIGLIVLRFTFKYILKFSGIQCGKNFHIVLFSYLRLLERIGNARLRKNFSDEGIMQALWGVIFRIEPAYQNICLRFIGEVLNKIDPGSCVYYIMISKDVHHRQYTEVSNCRGYDAFCFADKRQYLHGRNCMFLLLRALRERNYEFQIIRNDYPKYF